MSISAAVKFLPLQESVEILDATYTASAAHNRLTIKRNGKRIHNQCTICVKSVSKVQGVFKISKCYLAIAMPTFVILYNVRLNTASKVTNPYAPIRDLQIVSRHVMFATRHEDGYKYGMLQPHGTDIIPILGNRILMPPTYYSKTLSLAAAKRAYQELKE